MGCQKTVRECTSVVDSTPNEPILEQGLDLVVEFLNQFEQVALLALAVVFFVLLNAFLHISEAMFHQVVVENGYFSGRSHHGYFSPGAGTDAAVEG